MTPTSRARRPLFPLIGLVVMAFGMPLLAQFVYVSNNETPGQPGAVSAYKLDRTTGALTPVRGSPFPAGVEPIFTAVDPTARFAYVVNASSGDVSGYDIDHTTGALTALPGSPFNAINVPDSMAIDPTGTYAYVTKPGGFDL